MILKFKPEENNIKVFERLTGLECVANNFYEHESEDLPLWLKTKVEYECSTCRKIHLINFRGFMMNLEKNSKFICKSCITISVNKITNRKCIKHKKDKVDYKKIIYDKFGIILLDDVIRYRDYANFICEKHGEKKILLKNIIRTGCVECGLDKNIDIKQQKFIQKSIKIHNNKYDYSKVKYNGIHNYVIIICEKHGEFEQMPNNHLNGSGCSYCNYKISNNDFIERCISIHSDKFNYDRVVYIGNDDYIEIGCKTHGYFNQKARIHLDGFGCSKCKESIGERKISNILDYNNIKYISQYRLDDCKNKLPLPFDFYLPELNICIEYNGIQHYEPVEYFGGDKAFEYRKKNDKIKADYCNNNGIELLIISYNDNVEDKLNELLNNL